MSYSESFKASNKGGAIEVMKQKVDHIVAQQPIHAHDRDAIVSNSMAAINLLGDDDTKDVFVSFNGYVGSNGGEFTTVSLCCTASLTQRQPQ